MTTLEGRMSTATIATTVTTAAKLIMNSTVETPETADTVVWTRANAPLVERALIGGVYLFLALFFLFLQISVLKIFFSYDEYRRNACYRCVIVISIADAAQLLIHIYGSIITLFDNSFSPLAEKILGGLCNSICISLLPLGTILALNRLLIFLGYSEGGAHGLDFLLAGSCAWGGLFFVLYMTPHCGMAFRNYAWTYDLTLPWSETVELIDSLTTIPMLIAPLLFYLIIFGIIAAKRQRLTKCKARSGRAGRKLLAPQEFRLLAQCVIFFGCEASLLTVWHLQGQLFPDSPYTIAAINYYWVFYNGINPLLYLCLNRTIRHRILRLYLGNRVGKEHTTAIISGSFASRRIEPTDQMKSGMQ